MVPTTATPWSSRPNTHEATIAATTTTSAPGTRGATDFRRSSNPIDRKPTTTVSACAPSRFVTSSRSCSTVSFDVTGMPRIFESWPTISTTATPCR